MRSIKTNKTRKYSSSWSKETFPSSSTTEPELWEKVKWELRVKKNFPLCPSETLVANAKRFYGAGQLNRHLGSINEQFFCYLMFQVYQKKVYQSNCYKQANIKIKSPQCSQNQRILDMEGILVKSFTFTLSFYQGTENEWLVQGHTTRTNNQKLPALRKVWVQILPQISTMWI